MPTESDIRRLAAAYRRAEGRADEARSALYDALRAERAKGASLRALADMAGLSFARIAQITK